VFDGLDHADVCIVSLLFVDIQASLRIKRADLLDGQVLFFRIGGTSDLLRRILHNMKDSGSRVHSSDAFGGYEVISGYRHCRSPADLAGTRWFSLSPVGWSRPAFVKVVSFAFGGRQLSSDAAVDGGCRQSGRLVTSLKLNRRI